MAKPASKLPRKYFEALAWIMANDDTCWLHEEEPIPSVATCLVADIFKVEVAEVTRHLRIIGNAYDKLQPKE